MRTTHISQMCLLSRRDECLRWSRNVLFGIGILALGYVSFALVDAKVYQTYQSWRFQQVLADGSVPASSDEYLAGTDPPPGFVKRDVTDADNLLPIRSREGFPLGRIEIGAIGLDVMILEGIEDETLRRAVGHIPGTALPGQEGNVAIAGHRDTFFRPLRKIRQDDEITLTTLRGTHRYRVASTEIVEPEDVGVLDDSGDAILTLVTCYPFTFVGSAPQRFIVRARRIPA